jgi:membrane protein DedA with SNARE-associated domain
MENWVFDLVEQWGLPGVYLLMLLETVFPPIPSEVIMAVAGIQAARGAMPIEGVILAGTAGAMTGNYLWYLAARIVGIDRFRPLIERHGRWLTLDWPEVERARDLFGRFGGVIVMIARIIPTIRSVISIPAGMVRMRLVGFLVWSSIGTSVWCTALALAGWLLGREFEAIETVIGPLSTAVIVLMVSAYVWRQISWQRRQNARQQAQRPDGD